MPVPVPVLTSCCWLTSAQRKLQSSKPHQLSAPCCRPSARLALWQLLGASADGPIRTATRRGEREQSRREDEAVGAPVLCCYPMQLGPPAALLSVTIALPCVLARATLEPSSHPKPELAADVGLAAPTTSSPSPSHRPPLEVWLPRCDAAHHGAVQLCFQALRDLLRRYAPHPSAPSIATPSLILPSRSLKRQHL